MARHGSATHPLDSLRTAGADVPAPDAGADRVDGARRFANDALLCVAAGLSRRRDDLVAHSASVISDLFAVWAAAGLDPAEIWTELHKREQLGSLLMQLNRAQSRTPRRVLKPWKVDSTKLP